MNLYTTLCMGPSDYKCPPKCCSQKLPFSLLERIDQGLANNGPWARFGLLFIFIWSENEEQFLCTQMVGKKRRIFCDL